MAKISTSLPPSDEEESRSISSSWALDERWRWKEREREEGMEGEDLKGRMVGVE